METQIHGALVEVLGLGVLLLGSSGVGKSECALELVQRGHRLVADDVVRLRSPSPGDEALSPDVTATDDTKGDAPRIIGFTPEIIRHYLEIRGVGLVSVIDVYGPGAVRDEWTVDLCCRLEAWREGARYERVGIERPTEVFNGVAVPRFDLPVRPAGNMATLIEVAVRDQIQRLRGNNAAKRLDDRLRGRTRARGVGCA